MDFIEAMISLEGNDRGNFCVNPISYRETEYLASKEGLQAMLLGGSGNLCYFSAFCW